MFPSGEYDNERAKSELVRCIKNDRPILLVGAGCSVGLGYPDWDRLLSDMQRELSVNVPLTEDGLLLAQRIKFQLNLDGRIDDYLNYLERTFGPKPSPLAHSALHSALALLPFSGRATTNYDEAVESALSEARKRQAQTIDLCHPRRYGVFRYLRELGTEPDKGIGVLHLHGCYNNPEQIILTLDDYWRAYGDVPIEDSTGNRLDQSLDTPHRKVLWTLLAMHPVVFVGFSLKDPAFKAMLKVVRDDFRLGSDAHLTVEGWKPADDLTSRIRELRGHSVTPVFYEILPNSGNGEYSDHRNLERLMLDVARSLAIDVPSVKLPMVLDRMIGRVRDED